MEENTAQIRPSSYLTTLIQLSISSMASGLAPCGKVSVSVTSALVDPKMI